MTEISSCLRQGSLLQDQVELGDDDSYNHAFAILRHRGQLLFAAHYSIIPDLFLHYLQIICPFVHITAPATPLIRARGTFSLGLQGFQTDVHTIFPLMSICTATSVTTITAGTIDKVLKLHINIKQLFYSNIEQSIKAFSLAKQVKSPFATRELWKIQSNVTRVLVFFMCVFR